MKKRICLFGGYDADGIIDDYVIYYISELSKISDVYYLGDFNTSKKELEKLNKITKGAYAFRHRKYDFGSWQELVKIIGKEKIREYDELILANDSCFGPLFPIENVFKEMDAKKTDFWGLSCSRGYHIHIQSYFVVFSKSVMDSDVLFDFLDTVKEQKSLAEVCTNYEERLAYVLAKNNFTFSSYIPYGDYENQPYYNTANAINNKRFPLLKVKTFYGKVGWDPIKNWERLISSKSKYDINLIKKNLYRRGLTDKIIQDNLYYGKKLSYISRFKNLIKKVVFKLFKVFTSPIRKYMFRYIDNKYEQILNMVNIRMDEINERLADLTQKIQSSKSIKSNQQKKYMIIEDDQSEYIDYFEKDDYFIFREISNILINFDKYGKDILFLGNVDMNTCSVFLGQTNNNIVVANSKNLDKEDTNNYLYKINDLSTFQVSDSKKSVKFDLIFIEPFLPSTADAQIRRIFKNMFKQMINESTLIVNVKYLDQARMILLAESVGFIIDKDAITMYSGKIVSKMGYSVLFFRKKAEIDYKIDENKGR